MYTVQHSTEYDRLLDKLDPPYQQLLQRFEQRLVQEAYIGKPLGCEYLREKKFDDKRALFFVNQDKMQITMITIVDKRNQKEVINALKRQIETLRQL